jgi:hypothetical protein
MGRRGLISLQGAGRVARGRVPDHARGAGPPPARTRPIRVCRWCEAVDNRTYNTVLRGLRCLGERGFALLTGRWRALHHITASPARSAASSKPYSYSPISNTATTRQITEITTLNRPHGQSRSRRHLVGGPRKRGDLSPGCETSYDQDFWSLTDSSKFSLSDGCYRRPVQLG